MLRSVLVLSCSLLSCGSGALVTGCDSAKSAPDDEGGKKSQRKGDKKKGKKGKKRKKKKSKKSAKTAASASTTGEAESKTDDGSVPPPKPGEAPQFRVGAWSRYKTSTGTAEWCVLEERGSEFRICAQVKSAMEIGIEAWLDVPDRGDARTSTIRELKYRLNKGAVTTLSGSGLGGHAAMYGQIIKSSMPPKFEGMPQEDVTVAAGTFRGCYKWTSKSTFMGKTTESTVWSHPVVPAPSMVKMLSKEGQLYELVAYAHTGAKSPL